MQIDRTSTSGLPALRVESQTWVDASIPHKPLLDWRELVTKGLHFSGALQLARRLSKFHEIPPDSSLPFPRFVRVNTPKFVILCYHGIGESGNPLSVAPSRELFDTQMRFLHENYRVASLEEACSELCSGVKSEPGVVITFDDGYRSAYNVAFPILQQYRLPATIYLTVDSVETGQVAWYDRVFLGMAVAPSGELQLDLQDPWRFQLNSPEDRLRAALEVVAILRTLPNSLRCECCARLENRIGLPQNALSSRVLTWEEIHIMHSAGITFGSHTLSHPVVSQLAPLELEHELGASKCLLEKKLGIPVLDFAFPFGKASDCSPAALEMLSRCGYRSAVTTVPGVNTPQANLFELRRMQVGVDGSLARFAFDLARAFLQAEKLRPLNAPPTPASTSTQVPSSVGIGGALGDPDA
ncbi:MAG TPA: polysaccharide deacetylase family protein [Candidatus Acidoferrum sp.]|nr:polysaccharide deacetylase family protein [Candidatus Acidoferrum sp.]